MHRPFASEALMGIPEQRLTKSTCFQVSTCQKSWSEEEKKKKTNWHWLYEQTSLNQTYISQNTTHEGTIKTGKSYHWKPGN